MPKILVVTANSDVTPLKLATELRSIRDGLGEQSNFSVVHESEARPTDFIRRLRDDRPDILHFAGHGSNSGGEVALSFRLDSPDKSGIITRQDLRDILENLAVPPRLVVLNACYSAALATAINDSVGVVIGVTQEVGDETACEFAKSFYAAIGQAYSVKSAFELARVELKSSGFDAHQLNISAPRDEPRELIFYTRPELLAAFSLGPSQKPRRGTDKHYDIELWLRGADQHADSVTFQICHDSFKPKDRFWEVSRTESSTFLTDDFRTTGDVTIRATAWYRDRGIGTESTLSAALRRHYGERPTNAIRDAIRVIETS